MDASQLELEERYNRILAERAEILSQGNISESQQSQIAESTNNLLRERDGSNKKNTKSQRGLQRQLEKTASSQGKFNKSLSEGSRQAGILKKTMATLRMGYESIIKPLKSFYNLITMQGVYNFLIKTGAEYSGQMSEMFEATQNLKEAIGDLSGPAGARYNTFMRNLNRSTGALARSGKSLGAVFGRGVADAMKGVTAEIEKMGVAFDATMDALKGVEGEFILLSKGLGISSEALGTMARGSKDAKGEFGELAKTIVAGSKKFGINMKAAGKNVDAALKDVNNFGYMSRRELAQTALFATRLGMEMKDLTSFAEKFDTFEGAAESVGKLSSAFGIQLDTMELVMEDNPAKKLDMVRKALEAQGKSMDNILGNRRQAKYLADNLGIPIDKLKELQKVSTDEFGFDSLGEGLAEQEKEMTEMDALKEIAKQMKLLRDSFNDASGVDSFFGAIKKGFMEELPRTAAYRKMFGEINKTLRKFMRVGRRAARLVTGLFYKIGKDGKTNIAPLADIFDGFLEYFTYMGDLADKFSKPDGPLSKVFKILGDFASGDLLSGEQTNIFEILFAPFMGNQSPGQGLMNPKIRRGLVKFLRMLMNVLSDAFIFAGDMFSQLVDKMFAPPVIKKAAEEKAGDESMGEALGPVAEKLWESFSGMFEKLFKGSARIARGLLAYFIGGEAFRGKSITYEESILGQMIAGIRERMRAPIDPMQGDTAGRGIAQLIADMLGFDTVSETLNTKAATLGDGIKLMFLTIKRAMLTGLGDLIVGMEAPASRYLQEKHREGSALSNVNPMFHIMNFLSSGAKEAANMAYSGASEARKEIEIIEGQIKKRQEAYDEMEASVKRLAAMESKYGLTGQENVDTILTKVKAVEGSEKIYAPPLFDAATGDLIEGTGELVDITKANAHLFDPPQEGELTAQQYQLYRTSIDLKNTRNEEFEEETNRLTDKFMKDYKSKAAQQLSDFASYAKGLETKSDGYGGMLGMGNAMRHGYKNVTGGLANVGAFLNPFDGGAKHAMTDRSIEQERIKERMAIIKNHSNPIIAKYARVDQFGNITNTKQLEKMLIEQAQKDYTDDYLLSMTNATTAYFGDIENINKEYDPANFKTTEQFENELLGPQITSTPGYDMFTDSPMTSQPQPFDMLPGTSPLLEPQMSTNFTNIAFPDGMEGDLQKKFDNALASLTNTAESEENVRAAALTMKGFMQAGFIDPIDEYMQMESPSKLMIEKGVQMQDGLMIGLFGVDSNGTEYSQYTGFAENFAAQMEAVRTIIDDSYKDLAETSVASISTKLSEFGKILRGETPMHVVVENEKVVVQMQLQVNLDTEQLAYNLGKPTDGGGAFFVLNPRRQGSQKFYKLIEKQGAISKLG